MEIFVLVVESWIKSVQSGMTKNCHFLLLLLLPMEIFCLVTFMLHAVIFLTLTVMFVIVIYTCGIFNMFIDTIAYG